MPRSRVPPGAACGGSPAELYQQRPGVLQVARVEALAEPVVDRLEECAGLGRPALIAPEAREEGRRAQLVGSGLLRARDLEGALEVRLGVGRRAAACEDDLAQQPMEVSLRAWLARLHSECESALDGSARLGEPPGGQVRSADDRERARCADSAAGSATLRARQQVGDRLRVAGGNACRRV